jgi:hypothetical protein
MTKYLAKIHMNTTTFFRKRNVVLFVTGTILIVAVVVSASVIGSTKVTGTMIGDNSNQNYIMMYGYGPNITGSVTVGPTITKIIESQVHISLANASNIAEKAVGANAHTAAVRIGVVYGFLVYKALVVDSNYGCHDILVDAGNGKVLATVQRSWL